MNLNTPEEDRSHEKKTSSRTTEPEAAETQKKKEME